MVEPHGIGWGKLALMLVPCGSVRPPQVLTHLWGPLCLLVCPLARWDTLNQDWHDSVRAGYTVECLRPPGPMLYLHWV